MTQRCFWKKHLNAKEKDLTTFCCLKGRCALGVQHTGRPVVHAGNLPIGVQSSFFASRKAVPGMSNQNSDENFIFYLEKLFLAFPSLLESFLNSWQIYGPVLAFQVILEFCHLSKIVIVIVIAFQVIRNFCYFSKTVLFSLWRNKHLIITDLMFKTRKLPWESAHMTLKWQSSF